MDGNDNSEASEDALAVEATHYSFPEGQVWAIEHAEFKDAGHSPTVALCHN